MRFRTISPLSWCALLLSLVSVPSSATADILLNNENPAAVVSKPSGDNPRFTIAKLTTVNSIYTYHYNAGAGKTPGQIWLVGGPNNQKYGPWNATISSKFYWVVSPKLTLPPGTYSVFDSDPASWSCNANSKNQGFAQVHGTPVDLNKLASFDDVKGAVGSLQMSDRARIVENLNEDRKGPVKALLGLAPKPSVNSDKSSIRGATSELATLKLSNPFAGHQYTAILSTPGGTMSFGFVNGVATIPAAAIVRGYPLKAAKSISLKVMDTTVPQGWSTWTEVGTVTLTVAP
jgi:hypothetical protein